MMWANDNQPIKTRKHLYLSVTHIGTYIKTWRHCGKLLKEGYICLKYYAK